MTVNEDKEKSQPADSKQDANASPVKAAAQGKDQPSASGRRQGEGYASRKNRSGGGSRKNAQASEYTTETVTIRRVSQASKGGRSFAFSALVVSGDGKGRIGFGLGKSSEVPLAIQKATTESQRNMITVPMHKGTIHQVIRSTHGASNVLMMPAKSGTGIIAGNAMRAVFKMLGIENVVAKSMGSSNPINVVRATFSGLRAMKTAKLVAQKRGLSISDVLGISDEEA